MNHVLHLFPDRSLDQSILVAVFVGVLVLLFFCEVFGWVWAGLVVPGYLVSVIAVAPDSAIAVCVEAVITFVVSRGVSDLLCKMTGWSAFFGRERFFLIVLVSVVVRQVSELWLLHHISAISDQVFGTQFGQRQDLASIGLVLVPLLANMFWKLTLPRGVFQIGVTVAVTWLVVAKLLLPYTNLSFSSFQSTYEDVALDFLGSPKAYIVLLTTAWLAAYGNLVYGWDYNGIMVPSLLALTWFEPWSLLRTLVEALIILQLTKWVQRAPGIKQLNLEGPRKLATVFLVGFLCKFGTGWCLYLWFPAVHLTDYFGFGYVLTSLLAVKMLTIKKIGRVVFPSLAVSLLGFVIGSGIGLALHLLFPDTARADQPSSEIAVVGADQPWAHARSALTAVAARTRYIEPTVPRLQQAQLLSLWRSVDAWLAQSSSPQGDAADRSEITNRMRRALDQAAQLKMRFVSSDDNKAFVITEAAERIDQHHGFESMVVWPGRPGPVLVVGNAATDRSSIDTVYALCTSMLCRGVMVGGYDESSELASKNKQRRVANTARQAFGNTSVLLVEMGTTRDAGAELYIAETLGAEVNVGTLRQLVASANAGELSLHWSTAKNADQWASRAGGRGFATLVIPAKAEYQLGCGREPSTMAPASDGSIVSWTSMERTKRRLGSEASQQRRESSTADVTGLGNQRPARAATATEKLMIKNMIMPALVSHDVPLTCKAVIAQQLGMVVTSLPNGFGPGQGAIAFVGQGSRRWFTLVVPEPNVPAVSPSPIAFTASRASQEEGTDRIASSLAYQQRSSLLLVHQDDGTDIASNSAWFAAHIGLSETLSRISGNQSTTLELPWHSPWQSTANSAVVIDIRGFAAVRGLPGNVYLSAGSPVVAETTLPATLQQLHRASGPLGGLADGAQWVDGSRILLGLGGNGLPQVNYRRLYGGADVATAWFSSEVRTKFVIASSREKFVTTCTLAPAICCQATVRWMAAAAPPAVTAGWAWPWAPTALPALRHKRLLDIINSYQSTQDPAALALLNREFRGSVALGFDEESQSMFVARRHGAATVVHLIHEADAQCTLPASQWAAPAIADCASVTIPFELSGAARP